MKPLVVLLTDFGTKDWFVGVVKAVLFRAAPDVVLVDVTHEIPPGDIMAGAFVLRNLFGEFPENTIYLVVVDPGVGGNRQPIVIKTEPPAYLVGPDNGVMSWFLDLCESYQIRCIENPKIIRKGLGNTFHARDIFAPTAGWLVSGGSFNEIGRVINDIVRIPWPDYVDYGSIVKGQIIYIDRFGNCITNVPFNLKTKILLSAKIPSKALTIPIGSCYESVDKGEVVCLMGSSGFYEIAIRDGNAANILGLTVGMDVELVYEE